MKQQDVEFSELSLNGLEKIYPDIERRETARHAVEWYVKRDDTLRKSRACPAFEDKNLFVFPLHDMRVLFERNGIVRVWSIKKEVEDTFEPAAS